MKLASVFYIQEENNGYPLVSIDNLINYHALEIKSLTSSQLLSVGKANSDESHFQLQSFSILLY